MIKISLFETLEKRTVAGKYNPKTITMTIPEVSPLRSFCWQSSPPREGKNYITSQIWSIVPLSTYN